MDSVMILCNIALTYDNQLSEAYTVRGKYFNETGKIEQAIKELNKAIEFNPNDWMAYQASGSIFSDYDLVKSIENYQKAISLNHGPQLPDLLRSISWPYFCAGFIEKTEYYCQEAVKLDKDSLKYYGNLVLYASDRGHFAEAVELNKKLISIDSNKIGYDFSFGMNYSLLGQFKEALTYFKKWLETKPETLSEADLFGLHRVGLAYWQNGYKEEAEYYFDRLIKYCDKLKKMGRNLPARAAYDLAAVYAFKGDTEKAYENLRIFIQSPISYQLWLISYLKLDPLFDSMRNEQEFQQIVTDQEARYEAEHERVRKWLEERNIGMVE
jgi:tetratricopeptide (TPR) repeat protein